MTASRTTLVVGGAGYIGSHTVRALLEAGHVPVVFDNFSTGHREALPPDVAVIEGDLADPPALLRAMELHAPSAIVHFAASIEPGESMVDPRKYYRNNVVNSLHLLDAAVRFGIRQLVFSSSAATYGQPGVSPIPEDAPKQPCNPYGETKLIVEHVLRDYDRAYGLRSISLRYFNASGADPSGEIGEAHPNKAHVIEMALLTALGKRDTMRIFGTDYPTPDGTAVRDFIHVCDLADAHVRALQALEAGAATDAYNVGLGRGFSVREVVDTAEQVTGIPLRRQLDPRRSGDPATLVADPGRIRLELGWTPRFTHLEEIIETAWRWHRTHPDDYRTALAPSDGLGGSGWRTKVRDG